MILRIRRRGAWLFCFLACNFFLDVHVTTDLVVRYFVQVRGALFYDLEERRNRCGANGGV